MALQHSSVKKIDKLLIVSFIGPFAVSFGIALFVLIMQFLWLYIDEIAGKGVGIIIMLELLAYLSVSMFPMALPIAILIASVMVMGNLAERCELSSLKSAGVPLIRIMRGLILCASATGVFSYLCSNFIIPVSNLEFKSRLTDIQRQKPALALEKGVFNEDFRQFSIHIGDKAPDGETIGKVMIEDQSNAGKVKFAKIMADSGQMYTSDNRRFFVMNLFNGTQYREPAGQEEKTDRKFPFVRTHFKSWTKVWDMKEFEMVSADKDRLAGNRAMLSMTQLRLNIDSLTGAVENARQAIVDDLLLNIKRLPSKSGAATRAKPGSAGPELPVRQMNKPPGQYTSLDQAFRKEDVAALLKNAYARSRIAVSAIEARESQVASARMESVKTAYELYIKYSYALMCFIFVFIGGPMGAIIRKGGFGYPILVSIIFFVSFILLSTFCQKLAEGYLLNPLWAAMVPCMILAPVGVFLTGKAMNDSQMLKGTGFYLFSGICFRNRSIPSRSSG